MITFTSHETEKRISYAIGVCWHPFDEFGARAPTLTELYDAIASYTYNQNIHLLTVNNMVKESFRSRRIIIK